MKITKHKILFIILFIGLYINTYAQNAKEDYIKANTSFNNGHYTEAIGLLNSAQKKLKTSNALIEHLKVKCYFELEKFDQAETALHTFFKYKAADYLIEEMMEYAEQLRNEKMKLHVAEIKALQENSIKSFDKIQTQLFDKELNRINREISENNTSIKTAAKQKQHLKEEEDKKAFESACNINTLESYNEYLSNSKFHLFKSEAKDRIEYLKFEQIISLENFEPQAKEYIANNPEGKYSKKLKLILKHTNNTSLECNYYANGNSLYIKNQAKYLKAGNEKDALAILEHSIHLKTLKIGNYQIHSPVKVDLSLLKNLEEIDLSIYNPNISFEGIENLPKLKTLKIIGTKSSGSHLRDFSQSKTIKNLNIQYINESDRKNMIDILSNNQDLISLRIEHTESFDRAEGYSEYIDEVMEKITLLKKLNKLKILNSIFRLPSNIGNLSQLEELDLYLNKISEIPKSIGDMKNLKKLNLDHNLVKELPNEICNLENLSLLNLNMCFNIRSLPDNFGKLKSLENLNISRTNITNLPASFIELDNLTWLDIYESLKGKMGKAGIKRVKELKKKRPELTIINKFRPHYDNQSKFEIKSF